MESRLDYMLHSMEKLETSVIPLPTPKWEDHGHMHTWLLGVRVAGIPS